MDETVTSKSQEQLHFLPRWRKHFIVWVALIFIIVACTLGGYLHVVSQSETEQIHQQLKDLSNAQADYLHSSISRILDQSIATTSMLETWQDHNNIPFLALSTGKSFFSHIITQNLFTEIAFLDAEGTLRSVMDKAPAEWAQLDWSEARNGNYSLHINIPDKNGNKLLLIGYPFVVKGETQGLVIYGYSSKSFSDLMNIESFNGQGFGYLILPDGTYVTASDNPNSFSNINLNHWEEEEIFFKGNASMAINKKKVAAGEQFFVIYSAHNSERVAYYRPIGIDNWYLVSVALSTAFQEQTFAKRIAGYIVAVTILAIFALVLLLFLRTAKKYEKTLQLTYHKVKLEGIKMQLAASQVEGVVFEYLPETKYFRALSINQEDPDTPKLISEQDFRSIAVHPDDMDAYLDYRKNIRELPYDDNRDIEIELRIRLEAKGNYRWYKVKLFKRLEEGELIYIGTLQDIEYLKSLEKQKQREMYYQSLITSGVVSLILVNLTQNTILRVVPDVVTLPGSPTGTAYEERIGALVTDLVHPEDREVCKALFDRKALIARGENGEKECFGEYRRLYETGYHWVRCTIKLNRDFFDGNYLAALIVNDIEEDRLKETLLQKEAWFDSLTGLYNRRTAEKLIQEHIAKYNSKTYTCCLMFLDLDNMKYFNDAHGHPFGDAVLKAIADTLSNNLRDNDIISRWGGDEFLVLMKGCDEERAKSKAAHLLESFRAIKFEELESTEDKDAKQISCSIGFVIVSSGQSFETALAAADQALYKAKAMGKGIYIQGEIVD